MDTENKRLKQLRVALNLSQDEFGHAIGINKSGVSSIESGQRKVSPKHLRILKATYPTINEDWIRTGEGEMLFTSVPSVEEITNGALLDELDTKIIQCYLNLSQEKRQIIKEYLSSVFEEEETDMTEEERMEAEIQEELKRIEEQLRLEKRAKAKSSDLQGQKQA